MGKGISHAQGWGQLVLALKRRRRFPQIGFRPYEGGGIVARVKRRLIPRAEKLWLRWYQAVHPKSLIHFPWGDPLVETHKPDRRYVATLHQPYEKWESGTLDWCRQVGGIHTLTEREATYLREQVPGIKTRCILHGIDIHFWTPTAVPPPADRQRIIFCGRYMRNLPMFFRVIRRIREARPKVEVEMLLHPEFRFPPEMLPLPAGVKTVGPFSAEGLRDFMRSAWLMFMPYDNVTASNSVCEALACGLPFFTSRVGGMDSYSQGGMVLFGNNEDDAAFDAVVRCLDDPSWRADLSMRAREAAVKHLDWDVIAAQLDSFYAEIFSNPI